MAYAKIKDVQTLIPKVRIGATTEPSMVEVEKIIGSISVEIDSRLASRGHTTPATAPASFLTYLALVNSYGAAVLILKGVYPDSGGGSNTPGSSPAWALLEKRYQQELKAIADGSSVPPDLAVGADLVPRSYLTLHPEIEDDVDLGTAGEPYFNRRQRY